MELSAHPVTLGRLYVEEFAREAGGAAALRAVWERAAETGEDASDVLLESFAETTGRTEDSLLLRFGARLYATFETEPSPSRVSLADLELGALDAATRRSSRFATASSSPAPIAPQALCASSGRSRERAPRPSCVIGIRRFRPMSCFFRRGALTRSACRRVPSRLRGRRLGRASVSISRGRSGRAGRGISLCGSRRARFGRSGRAANLVDDGVPSGPVRLGGLSRGSASGRTDRAVRARNRPLLNNAENSFRYLYVDTGTSPVTYYRYTVWAVTQDGLLARAFSATLRTE